MSTSNSLIDCNGTLTAGQMMTAISNYQNYSYPISGSWPATTSTIATTGYLNTGPMPAHNNNPDMPELFSKLVFKTFPSEAAIVRDPLTGFDNKPAGALMPTIDKHYECAIVLGAPPKYGAEHIGIFEGNGEEVYPEEYKVVDKVVCFYKTPTFPIEVVYLPAEQTIYPVPDWATQPTNLPGQPITNSPNQYPNTWVLGSPYTVNVPYTYSGTGTSNPISTSGSFYVDATTATDSYTSGYAAGYNVSMIAGDLNILAPAR